MEFELTKSSSHDDFAGRALGFFPSNLTTTRAARPELYQIQRVTKRLTSENNSFDKWRMSEASNSRSLQRVYEITVFDGTLEERLPACLIIIHFTQASRQLMTKRGQDVLLAARKIAKRLAFPLDEPMRAGMKVRDTFLDIDMLGPPADYPDNSGSMAWVSYGKNALRGSS
jgi:hypothetical protein